MGRFDSCVRKIEQGFIGSYEISNYTQTDCNQQGKISKQSYLLHSVSEDKKRYIRNYTQILENLRNAIVGFFGLRNEFENVQENKKHNTQNIQVKKQKKNTHLNFSVSQS